MFVTQDTPEMEAFVLVSVYDISIFFDITRFKNYKELNLILFFTHGIITINELKV